MEAPIPIQAPHSRSHLFRSHPSSYSNDIYRRTSRDTMPSQPQRHYYSSDTVDSNAPSSDRTQIDLARQQAGCRSMMHPAHSVPQQLNPQRQDPRVSVSHLLESPSPNLGSRQSIATHSSPSQPPSAPISPRNMQPTPAETRLPGVNQVSIPVANILLFESLTLYVAS
jgi:hypothetical protein